VRSGRQEISGVVRAAPSLNYEIIPSLYKPFGKPTIRNPAPKPTSCHNFLHARTHAQRYKGAGFRLCQIVAGALAC